MAVKIISIRLATRLVDEAAKIIRGHFALREIVALKRFKYLMKKNAGKLSFDGYLE